MEKSLQNEGLTDTVVLKSKPLTQIGQLMEKYS